MITSLLLATALSLPADVPAVKPAPAAASPRRMIGIVVGAVTAAAGVAGLCVTALTAPVSALMMVYVVQRYGTGDPRVVTYAPASKWDDDHERWAWNNTYRWGFYGAIASVGVAVLSVVLVAAGAGTALSWALGGEEARS